MSCFTGTNAGPSITSTFGVKNMPGTNSFTIDFPTKAIIKKNTGPKAFR
jgi:hypothetical protein